MRISRSLTALTLLALKLSAQAMVNAASGGSAVSPGSIVSIYGSFPLPTGQAVALPLPAAVGVYSFIGSGAQSGTVIHLPLFFWSPGQVNALLPSSPAPHLGSGQFGLIGPSGPVNAFYVNVQSQAPGIFTNPTPDCSINAPNCGQTFNRAIATDAGSVLIARGNPVRPKQGIAIWCTGVGSGPTPEVTITSVLGSPLPARVFYSGETSLAGLDQVNIYLPSGPDLVGACSTGLRMELKLSMKSTTSGVVSNAIYLPVLIDSCLP